MDASEEFVESPVLVQIDGVHVRMCANKTSKTRVQLVHFRNQTRDLRGVGLSLDEELL